jgi:hypothetical protein
MKRLISGATPGTRPIKEKRRTTASSAIVQGVRYDRKQVRYTRIHHCHVGVQKLDHRANLDPVQRIRQPLQL